MSNTHILTEAEIAAQRREREGNPAVLVAAVKCWCDDQFPVDKPFWQYSGDQVTIHCRKGHVSVIRYAPETVGRTT